MKNFYYRIEYGLQEMLHIIRNTKYNTKRLLGTKDCFFQAIHTNVTLRQAQGEIRQAQGDNENLS